MTRRRIVLLGVAVLALLVAGSRRAREPNVRHWVTHGEAAAARGTSDEVRRAFERALAIDPTQPVAAEGLARLAEQAGDRASAAAARRAVATAAERERWPLASRATALRNAGLASLRSGDFDAALDALAKQQALGVSTLETDLTLAALQLARGGHDAAMQERLVARYGVIEPTFRLALAADAQRQHAATLDELMIFLLLRRADEAATSTPTITNATAPVARALAAQAAVRHGDIGTARRGWDSLRQGPLGSLAALELAKLDLAAGNPVDARAQLDACRSDRRVPCESWFHQQARALQAEHQLDAARAAADSAIACNPLASRSVALLAVIESERGQQAAADEARRVAQELEAAAVTQAPVTHPAR